MSGFEWSHLNDLPPELGQREPDYGETCHKTRSNLDNLSDL